MVLLAVLALGAYAVTRGGTGHAAGPASPPTPERAHLAELRGSGFADVAQRAAGLTDAVLLADGRQVCAAGGDASLTPTGLDASVTLVAHPTAGRPDALTTSDGSPTSGDAPLALAIVTAAQDDLCPR